jgi:hypothetical protein
VTSADTQPHAASSAVNPTSRILPALLVSGALVIGSFVWQGSYGFNIGDEGFLWYGVQRVQAGETPVLDFMSYDLGRYYWSAALMGLLRSDGIIALRIAGAVFQFLGLFVGLLLLSRQRARFDIPSFALAAITLLAWMFTWYKDYDTSVSIILIGSLTLLVQQPSRRRFFAMGIIVGLAAVFGRNHGLYGVAGVLGIVIYLACLQRSTKGLIAGLMYCICGVVVGYLPMLVVIVAVPGFASVFWEGIRAIFDRSATNLPLPVPWPWLVLVRHLPWATAAGNVLTGGLFIAVLVFGVLSTLWVVRQALRQKPADPRFVATSVLTLPYAQYAFSRADLTHLALGIFPFLIGIFLLLKERSRRMRWVIAAAMASASLLIVLPLQPGWNCRVIEQCVTMEVGDDTLKIEPLIGRFITMLQSVTGQYAPNGRNFLVTPLWPGAYALFKRKSPMWEIYALFPRENKFELQEIAQIKAAEPGFVLVLDIPVDGRDDLRFRNTHPLIERYIRDNFDPVTVNDWPPPTFQFYKSR